MIDIGFNVFDGFYMGITFLLSLGSIFITTLALVSMFPAIELERRKGVLAKKLDDLCDCVFIHLPILMNINEIERKSY